MSAKEVATIIKDIIDTYWLREIDKDQAKQKIAEVLENKENRIKVFRGEELTGVFKRIMGSRRLSVFRELLNT